MRIDPLTKRIGIIVTILFTITYYSFKYCNERINLSGEWASRENDGKNFYFSFFKKDSLKISNPEGDFNFYRYEIEDEFLIVYEEDIETFKWEVKQNNKKLILKDDKSFLVLYK